MSISGKARRGTYANWSATQPRTGSRDEPCYTAGVNPEDVPRSRTDVVRVHSRALWGHVCQDCTETTDCQGLGAGGRGRAARWLVVTALLFGGMETLGNYTVVKVPQRCFSQ